MLVKRGIDKAVVADASGGAAGAHTRWSGGVETGSWLAGLVEMEYPRRQARAAPIPMSIITLYRPVGPEELKLVEESGWRAFPPRLPEQPIFYPVVQKD